MKKSNSYTDIGSAVEIIRNGGMIIMADDRNRENEGDIVQAAEFVTKESINFMASFAKGLICVPVTKPDADRMSLSMMVENNDSMHTTAFTVSVDAKVGTTTGISAAERAETIKQLADPAKRGKDFLRPGHIFPLVAAEGGVLKRRGHTEGSLDIVRLAGLRPAAAICEIMKDDGEMARGEDLEEFADKHNLRIVTIEDLVNYIEKLKKQNINSRLIPSVPVSLPTKLGNFKMITFNRAGEKTEPHFALVTDDYTAGKAVTVRIHSECLTGDVLHSLRCDCGEQLEKALGIISREGGVLIYLRQEGRGIGLSDKIKTYDLQEKGADTVEANLMLGYEADLRDYGDAVSILRYLDIDNVKLLTNNPEKVRALENGGITVKRSPLETEVNSHNSKYLSAKKEKMGHELALIHRR